MKIKYTLAALAASALTGHAAVIASFEATETATPLDLTPEGTNTTWAVNDTTLGVNDVQEAVLEGSQWAWRNRDAAHNNNPGYKTTLTSTNFQDMYDNGWSFVIRARLEQGGQFVFVGGDNTNTGGGYNFAGDRRIGASFAAVDTNTYSVTPVGTGGTAVNITNGILNDTYIRIVIESAANSTAATWSVFNDDTSALISSQNLTDWTGGNTSTDDSIGFMSGSSGGDNREVLYREVSLNTGSLVPEPSSTALIGLGGIALLLRRRK